MKNRKLYLNIEYLKQVDLLEFILIQCPKFKLNAPIDSFEEECETELIGGIYNRPLRGIRIFTTTIIQSDNSLSIPNCCWDQILYTPKSELRKEKIKFLLKNN